MKKLFLLAVIFILIVAPEMAAQQVPHRVFMPSVKVDPSNGRKGVALAYGWVANPDGARILGVGTKLRWWTQEADDNLSVIQVFWCDSLQGESLYPLLAQLQSGAISKGIVRLNGKPLVLLGNEPDNASQCNKSPAEFATIYEAAVAACPDCIFTFPSVSAWDMFCDWPAHERRGYHATLPGGGWCWSKSFMAELQQRGISTAFPVCAFRHYYSIGWHEPKRNIAPMEPGDKLAALVGCDKFVVPEYGTCDPVFMKTMTNVYNDDSRVLAYYVWTPNLPPAGNGFSQCEVLFDWATGELTDVGVAFMKAGREQ